MALSTPYAIHFDIEIIQAGNRTGRYINRGTSTASGFVTSNDLDIYCLPNIAYRFDPTSAIDASFTQYRNQSQKNISYVFSKDNILWDFGDGYTSQKLTPTHTFNTPGEYTINVTLFDHNGQPRKNPYAFKLRIKNPYPDKFNWISANYSAYGIEYTKNSQGLPLTLHRVNSWQTPEAYSTLSLYVSASNSIPGTPDSYNNNKYAHFQKLWRFTEDIADPIPIDSITTSSENISVTLEKLPLSNTTASYKTPTYFELTENSSIDNDETFVVATSGSSSLYYIDDSAKNYLSRDIEPVFLFAASNENTAPINSIHTLEQDVDVLPVKILYETCNDIQISTNGMPTFTLQKIKYTNSLNNINVSAISSDKIISKSDYPKFNLRSSTDTTPLTPFDIQFTIIDPVSAYDNTNLVVTEKTYPSDLTLNGSGSYIITPKAPTSNQAKLRADVYIQDPIYCPLDTRAYVLTSMFANYAHIIQPLIAGGGASRWSTLADNTIDSNIATISITYDTSSHTVDDLELKEAFPVCVDPQNVHIYIGDAKRDAILKMDRHATRLNHENPINISELLCVSGVIESYNPNCSLDATKPHPLSNLTGNALLLNLYDAELEDLDLSYNFDITEPSSPCDFVAIGDSTNKSLSPSSISCDSTGDIWVTLIDGVLTVKIHPNVDGTHSVTAIAIPTTTGGTLSDLLATTASGERLYMPSRVETDKNDNIWVSYTNTEHVAMRLYNSSGCELSSYIFDSNDGVYLDDMLIDPSDNLWVTNSTYTPQGELNGGSIICFRESTEGNIYIKHTLTTYTTPNGVEKEFDKPSQLTCDLTGMIYVSTGSNEIVEINPATQECKLAFYAGSEWRDGTGYTAAGGRRNAIDALSSNSDNKLLAVNNVDKKLYIYDPENSYSVVYTRDLAEYNASQSSAQDGHKVINKDGYDLVQGSGDWTGIKWILKYLIPASSSRIISKEIDIHVRAPSEVDILKVNERFDATEMTASYTLQETISRNTNFIYWFFKQILGDGSSLPESLGKRIYEKIANFTSNNSDVDICNIDSLISLSEQVGFDIKRYDYTYPGAIKRLVDLFSINYTRLAGSRDKSDDVFLKNGYAADFNHGRNMGESITFNDYTVNVGTRLVAKELYNSYIALIEPMAIRGDEASSHWSPDHSGITQYPLSGYSTEWGWGLSFPSDSTVDLYYDFYDYVPNESVPDSTATDFVQVEGVIDWDNPLTTVTEEQITDVVQFNGPGGIMDNIIDQRLRTGFELFIK